MLTDFRIPVVLLGPAGEPPARVIAIASTRRKKKKERP
jgi:hypothetical protein